MAHMGRSAAVIIVKVGSTEVFSSVFTQISVFPQGGTESVNGSFFPIEQGAWSQENNLLKIPQLIDLFSASLLCYYLYPWVERVGARVVNGGGL